MPGNSQNLLFQDEPTAQIPLPPAEEESTINSEINDQIEEFISEYNREFQEKITKKLTEPPRGYLGMSQIGDCERKLVMEQLGYEAEATGLKGLMAFRIGKIYEEIVIEDEKELLCMEIVSRNDRLIDEDLIIKGHYDAIIRINMPDKPHIHGCRVLKEYKALNTDSFLEVKKVNDVSESIPKYYEQIQMYLHHLIDQKLIDLPICIFQAADKGRGITINAKGEETPGHTEIIWYNSDKVKELQMKAFRIKGYIEEKILPPIPEGYFLASTPCLFCNCKKHCYKIDTEDNSCSFSNEDKAYLENYRRLYKTANEEKKERTSILDIIKDNIDALLTKNKQKSYINKDTKATIRKSERSKIDVDETKAFQLIPADILPKVSSITKSLSQLNEQLPKDTVNQIVTKKPPTITFEIK